MSTTLVINSQHSLLVALNEIRTAACSSSPPSLRSLFVDSSAAKLTTQQWGALLGALALPSASQMRNLEVTNIPVSISTLVVPHIANVAAKNLKSIESLSIRNAPLCGDKSAGYIGQCLARHPTLRKLALEQCDLRDGGIQEFVSSLFSAASASSSSSSSSSASVSTKKVDANAAAAAAAGGGGGGGGIAEGNEQVVPEEGATGEEQKEEEEVGEEQQQPTGTAAIVGEEEKVESEKNIPALSQQQEEQQKEEAFALESLDIGHNNITQTGSDEIAKIIQKVERKNLLPNLHRVLLRGNHSNTKLNDELLWPSKKENSIFLERAKQKAALKLEKQRSSSSAAGYYLDAANSSSSSGSLAGGGRGGAGGGSERAAVASGLVGAMAGMNTASAGDMLRAYEEQQQQQAANNSSYGESLPMLPPGENLQFMTGAEPRCPFPTLDYMSQQVRQELN